MDIATVNKELRRNVKTHTKYDRYFTFTPCKSTYLGNYTTTGGLQQMVELALKYKDFSREISKVLKGRNLEETVANIHQFIYEHVQYNADYIDQELKSPSCTWSSRFEGTDCKSQSLFASTILLCLNIPHSFRKVRQKTQPQRWSHVYVSIPTGFQTLIIDPTKRENTEVEYIQKEDMQVTEARLPYFGMHGELPSVPSSGAETISNFRNFLADLNKLGVSKTVTQRIEREVRKNTDRGIDPIIKLQSTHIVVHSVTIPYGVNIDVPGMGWVATTTTAVTSLFNSGFFSSLFGKQTSADEVMRDSMGRIQRMISQVSSMNLGAEEHTNKVLYNIGWLRAMHVRNGAHASSTRMKQGNAGAVTNIDNTIREIFKKLASQASFTKQQKSVTFPGSNPSLGVNTHSNPGSYFVIKITGGVRGGGNTITNVGSNTGTGSQNINTGGSSQNSNSGGTPIIPTGNGNVPSQNNNQNPNNNPPPKKGMSTTTKVVLGGAAVLAVGTAMYLKSEKNKSHTDK
ncbi:hypothetical protein [Tenacibaculum aiptasiae]|uniref:hypothetical protein n=1 Tax=Tenacibaculum aiptasiae TaxID=426481 RepID=UPI00232C9C64|nr:hypothetical protein [Tenacibaculum aiptasiae]